MRPAWMKAMTTIARIFTMAVCMVRTGISRDGWHLSCSPLTMFSRRLTDFLALPQQQPRQVIRARGESF